MTIESSSTKALFVFLLILAAGVGMIVTTPVVAHALGVAHEKNFGQCKQDKNDNACRQVVKPGNG